MLSFVLIVSSVQTHCLYCCFCLILVIPFNWGLSVGHYEVDLLGVPALYDGFGQDEPYGAPHCNWCKCVPLVMSFDLVRAFDVEAHFPLVDFPCLNPFASHLPDCWENGGTLWNLGSQDQ